jgi:hypothetical protein
MFVLRRRISVAIASVLLLAAGQSAAQPLPPAVVAVEDYRSKPHLLDDRLDYSFCEYPSRALREGVEGCCRMNVEITSKGRAGKMSGECTNEVFLAPSRLCLAPQSFLPALKKGKPVSGSGEIVVYFQMDSRPNLVEQVLGFFKRRSSQESQPEPEICRQRPGDLISTLPRFSG